MVSVETVDVYKRQRLCRGKRLVNFRFKHGGKSETLINKPKWQKNEQKTRPRPLMGRRISGAENPSSRRLEYQTRYQALLGPAQAAASVWAVSYTHLVHGTHPFLIVSKVRQTGEIASPRGLSALERRLSFVFPFDIYSIPFQL